MDEAGRGAWAGPVVAAAVVFPNDRSLVESLIEGLPGGTDRRTSFAGIRDSKQLSPAQRASADRVIRASARGIGLGVVPPQVIDEMGLALAGQLALWRAVCSLSAQPDHVLVDGFHLWSPQFPQTAIIHGDAICASIAAASIVAKVARDRLMERLEVDAPGYGFGQNRGYGTAAHARALRERGPSCHHRRSFAPLVELTGSVDG